MENGVSEVMETKAGAVAEETAAAKAEEVQEAMVETAGQAMEAATNAVPTATALENDAASAVEAPTALENQEASDKADETVKKTEAPAEEKADKPEPKGLSAEPAPTESMEDYKDAIDRTFRKVEEGDILTGTVIGMSDDDVMLDLQHYASGIIRKADLSEDPKFNIRDEIKVGEEITATVINTDDGRGNILLSRKEAAQSLGWENLKKAMDEKTEIEVKIREAVKAGVICYPEGLRAFIPASKLALNFIEEAELPSYVGKTVKAQVITCDEKKDRLVLSCRDILREQARKEREQMISNVEVGLVTEGTVESLQNYGAFIDLGKGMSGLVHISQISNNRIAHPSAVLKVGDKVKVRVTRIKDGKLSLSMRDLEDSAAEEVTEEKIEYKSEGEVTTSLADLIKKAGF